MLSSEVQTREQDWNKISLMEFLYKRIFERFTWSVLPISFNSLSVWKVKVKPFLFSFHFHWLSIGNYFTIIILDYLPLTTENCRLILQMTFLWLLSVRIETKNNCLRKKLCLAIYIKLIPKIKKYLANLHRINSKAKQIIF